MTKFLDPLKHNEEDADDECEKEHLLLECNICEARFRILLEEDFLYEDPRYCPFCGDYMIHDE